MKARLLLRLPVLLMLVAVTAVPSAASAHTAGSYRMTDLGTLGGQDSYATAMNDRGDVVGGSQAADGSYHNVLWRHGRIIDLGQLYPMDVNNRGQVTGYMDVGDQYWHSFLWTSGRLVDLGTDGLRWSMPIGMNDRGQVVCNAYTLSGDKMFLWSHRRATVLPLDSISAVNNRGQVAGGVWSETDGIFHAAIWWHGRVTVLPAPSMMSANTIDINDSGWAIGFGRSSDGYLHSLLWRSGRVTDLPTHGSSSWAVAINNAGQILVMDRIGSGDPYPALWQRGRLTDLTGLGLSPVGSYADINAGGAIAGTVRVQSGASHAVIYFPRQR